MTRARRLTSLLALLVIAAAGAAEATVVFPISPVQMARQADAIGLGTVTALESYWDAGAGQIFTLVTLEVHEALKGPVGPGELTIKQPGGVVGGLRSWIVGAPEFRRGEFALVVLHRNRDGTLRVAHLFQGKLPLAADPDTSEILVVPPDVPWSVDVLRGVIGGGPRPLREVVRELRALVDALPSTSGAAVTATPPPGALRQVHESFELWRNGRWFEPDAGEPITMLVDVRGEPRAPGRGFDAVRAAFAAWNRVAGSAARFRDGGVTDAPGLRRDGQNVIAFRDPLGQIDAPVDCRGTIAIATFWDLPGEVRSVNGMAFSRIVEGDVVLGDGWDGCGVYESRANLAEVLAHELGHVLGLGHSDDPEAVMYRISHMDGRGAALRSDDVAGVRFIYPSPWATLAVVRAGNGDGMVRSDDEAVDCGRDCSEVYGPNRFVTLSAVAAPGSIFQGWSGGCRGTGSCRLAPRGNTTVTATFALPPPTVTIQPATPVAAEAGLTAGTFVVTRSGTTQIPVTVRYTVRGTARAGVDYVALPGSVTLAAGQTSATIAVRPLDDALVETAETVVASLTLDPAYRVGAPATATIAITSDDAPGQPDLVIEGLTLSASRVAPGSTVAVSYRVANRGRTPVTASYTERLYLGRDGVPAAGARWLASTPWHAADLSPNATLAWTHAVRIPNDTQPGAYVLLVEGDAAKAIAESSETNNVAGVRIEVAIPATARRR